MARAMTLLLRRYRLDILLAGTVTVLTVLLSDVIGSHHHTPRSFDVFGAALLFGAGTALGWRRRFPNRVLVVVFLLVMAYDRLGYPKGAGYLPLIFAFFTAITRGDRRVAYPVLVAGFLLSALAGSGWAGALGLSAWFLVLAATAEIARIWTRARRAEEQQAVQAQQARIEQERRRAGEERLRIAQDLHDVLAHQLALITVQANAGLAMLHRAPDRTGDSLRAIKDAGNTALSELHVALDALRTPQTGTAQQPLPRRPLPLLSRDGDLVALIDGARAAGLRVDHEVHGEPVPVPALVDQAGYRILQEALTNAVRHAGPGSTATVCIDYRGDALRVRVEDDGAGTAHSGGRDSGGKGLPGMRERVAALHGTLSAGPRPDGGFAVDAVLPIGRTP